MNRQQIVRDTVLLAASALSALYFLLLYACYYFKFETGVLAGVFVELFTIPLALTSAAVLVYVLFLMLFRRCITIRLIGSGILSALVVAALLMGH